MARFFYSNPVFAKFSEDTLVVSDDKTLLELSMENCTNLDIYLRSTPAPTPDHVKVAILDENKVAFSILEQDLELNKQIVQMKPKQTPYSLNTWITELLLEQGNLLRDNARQQQHMSDLERDQEEFVRAKQSHDKDILARVCSLLALRSNFKNEPLETQVPNLQRFIDEIKENNQVPQNIQESLDKREPLAKAIKAEPLSQSSPRSTPAQHDPKSRNSSIEYEAVSDTTDTDEDSSTD